MDDLKIHPRDGDLVVATHGRSLYVVDDVSPLAQATTEAREKDAVLFAPRPALGIYRLPGWSEWNGKAHFRGENPPEGRDPDLLAEGLHGRGGPDRDHERERTSRSPRFTRPGRPASAASSGTSGRSGRRTEQRSGGGGGGGFGEQPKFVPPGDYTVTLTYGKTKAKQKLKVTIAEGIETK